MAEKNKVTVSVNDSAAIWSFGLGLASIFFSWVGIVPLMAILLGGLGIHRTKESGTGRWMAVIGLILGIAFFTSNMVMNDHLLGLSNRTVLKASPDTSSISNNIVKVSEQEMTAEPIDFITSKQKDMFGGFPHTISVKFTNKTEQTIIAFKTRLCVDTLFQKAVLCRDIEKYETVLPKGHIIVDITFDSSYGRIPSLDEIKKPSSLNTPLSNLSVKYENDI